MSLRPYFPAQDGEKFRLQKLQFQSNQTQLAMLRKKLLADSYNQQIHQKQQQNGQQTTATTRKSQDNPQLYNGGPTFIDINMAYVENERKAKHELAREYERQMERKQSLERLQRDKKMEEEKRMLDGLKQMNKIQEERYQNNVISYRRQVTEQVEAAKRKHLEQAERKNKQREEYKKKFQPLPRNYAFNDNTKLNKFKQHFDHVNRIQYKIEKDYLDNWGSALKQKQLQKQRLIEAGIAKVHDFQKTLHKKTQEIEQKHRFQYKEALERQIKQKQQIKSLEKARQKSEAYTPSSYKNLHHPIYNPVDFKMAHDNKKILRQLKQQEEFENRMSGLARNGSIVMMPSFPTE